ncbi:hypothetical protein [Sphingomonas hankookensis]
MTIPPMASEWPQLARAARHILAQREAHDPQQVAKGRLTEVEAATRLRIARALSAQWDSIAAGIVPYDAETAWIDSGGAEGAYPHELHADLSAGAALARARADRHDTDREAEHFAQCVAALAWHARPRDHISHILDVAHANVAIRAGRAGKGGA